MTRAGICGRPLLLLVQDSPFLEAPGAHRWFLLRVPDLMLQLRSHWFCCVTAAWGLQTRRCLVVPGTTEEPPQVVWECSSANEHCSATAGIRFPALSPGREHSKHLWSKAGGTPKLSPGPSSCNPSVTLTMPPRCGSSWRVPKASASGVLQDCPGTRERLCQQHSV